MSGVAEGDCAEQGDANLCGVGEPGSCAHADRDTAADLGVTGGTIFEGQEFAQAVIGVFSTEEAVLGTALMGPGVLGVHERECHG